MLTGTVVGPNGEPIADGELYGEPFGDGHAGFKTRTDQQGRFTTERWTDETLLIARAAKANLAVTQLIMPTQQEVHLELQPGASVSGTARKQDGTPLTNARVIGVVTDIVHSRGVNLVVASDEKGEFTLRGIPVGTHLELQLLHSGKWHKGPAVEVKNAAPIRNKDLVLTAD